MDGCTVLTGRRLLRRKDKHMAKRSIVPFGPQHPVLPEPVHLDLVLEDETVVGAIPNIGFVHRGLEKLVELKDFKSYVYIAERVCGICSCGHGIGYCESVEHVMEVEIPERAKYLRTIWMEMSRITAIFCGWDFWQTLWDLKVYLWSPGGCGRRCWTCLI